MPKQGAVGGAATLSSFRVQKAFSINFRENKRLLSEIRLIENEHIRNIRHIKQEIKETRIWWEGVRESTGESHHGLRPDSEPSLKKNRRRKMPARSKTTEPEQVIPQQPAPSVSQFSGDDYDDMTTKYSEQPPVPKVHFEAGGAANATDHNLTVPVARPWTEMNASSEGKSNRAQQHHRADLKSEPVGNNGGQRTELLKEESTEEADKEQTKNRIHSATSVRSSLASLTTYQRRHRLQSMMVKKQNPLEYKRQMNSKDCQRVTNKMKAYLEGLSGGIRINMPDLTKWGVDPEHHDTPFAQDVNLN